MVLLSLTFCATHLLSVNTHILVERQRKSVYKLMYKCLLSNAEGGQNDQNNNKNNHKINNLEMHNHAIIFFCNLFQQLMLSYFAITLT